MGTVSPIELEAIEHARAMVVRYEIESTESPGDRKTADELAAWRRRLAAATAKTAQQAPRRM